MAPVKSRLARAGGSCFVAVCTFSFPIVGWAAIIFVPRGQPTVCSKLDPRVSLRYHGTGSLHDKRADLHKEDVYSTSIVVSNSGIQICPGRLAIAAARQTSCVFVSFCMSAAPLTPATPPMDAV